MLVREVLKAKSRGVITIRPEATVQEALALFVENNIGSLPVVDLEGHLVGIFSERDVLYGVHEDCVTFGSRHIRDVMTPNPITCAPGEMVHEVMGRISQYGVGQLPVVENDRLVGVVSVGDLIRSMYDRVDTENRHLMTYLYGSNA
jgi:CBS domain-containing protein